MIQAEASTTIRRSIHEVFSFVSDPRKEPAWHADVTEAAPVGAGPIGMGRRIDYRFRFMGRDTTSIGEVVAFESPRLESIRFAGGPLGMQPTITFRLVPLGGSVRFTRIVAVEPAGLGRLLEPLLRGYVARRNAMFVENLRRRLEGA